MVGARDDSNLSTARSWLLFVVMSLTMFACVFNTLGVMTALPIIGQDLHMGFVAQTWGVVGFSISTTAFIMSFVQLSNRYGVMRFFIIGHLLFIISCVLAALSNVSWLLIVARIIQGVSYALLFPTSLSLIKNAPKRRYRQLFIVLWTGSQVLGGAVGPIVAGALSEHATWRLLFWVTAAISLVALLLCFGFASRVKIPRVIKKFDYLGSFLLIAFCVIIVLLMNQGIVWGWTSPALISFYALAPLLLVGFIISQSRVVNPIMDLSIFGNGAFLLGTLLYFSMGVLIYSINYFFNIFAQSNASLFYSATFTGLVLMIFNLPAALLSFVDEVTIKKTGFVVPLVLGNMILCCGLFLFWLLHNTSTTVVWWKLLICGIGMGVAYPVCTALAMLRVIPKRGNEASGIVNFVNYLGSGVGISGAAICFSVSLQHTLHKVAINSQSLPFTVARLHELLFMSHAKFTVFVAGLSTSLRAPLRATLDSALQHAYATVNMYLVIFALFGLLLSILVLAVKRTRT